MNRYVGDFSPGKTVRLMFNTNQPDGTPITLAGTPAVSVYKDASTTESTAGVTLTVDFDARTGLHQVVVDTSADGTFYSAASDFRAVITAGTVNGVSVVGVVVGGFSLSNRAALRPVTADRTIAVDGSGRVDLGEILGTASAGAAGYVGIDWGHVNAPTTSVALTGTTISTSQTVATVANAVTLPTIPSNWITAAGVAAAALNGKGDWNTTTPPTAAAVATAVWTDATAGDFATNGTPGKILVAQLGGTFTSAISSVFSTASLVNGPAGGGSGGATPQAVATAVWQDLTNTADFTTVGSVGALLVGGKLLDSILVESGVNLPQAIAIIAAAAAGQSSGVDVGSPIYKAINNAGVTRITATATNGNRSSVTVNLPNI